MGEREKKGGNGRKREREDDKGQLWKANEKEEGGGGIERVGGKFAG